MIEPKEIEKVFFIGTFNTPYKIGLIINPPPKPERAEPIPAMHPVSEYLKGEIAFSFLVLLSFFKDLLGINLNRIGIKAIEKKSKNNLSL